MGKVELAYVKLVINDDLRFTGMLQLKKRANKAEMTQVLPNNSEVRGIVKEDVDRGIGALHAMVTPGSNQETLELGVLTRQGGSRKR